MTYAETVLLFQPEYEHNLNAQFPLLTQLDKALDDFEVAGKPAKIHLILVSRRVWAELEIEIMTKLDTEYKKKKPRHLPQELLPYPKVPPTPLPEGTEAKTGFNALIYRTRAIVPVGDDHSLVAYRVGASYE